MTSTTKMKVEKNSFIVKKSYNKTVIDFNFGRHDDLLCRLRSKVKTCGIMTPASSSSLASLSLSASSAVSHF